MMISGHQLCTWLPLIAVALPVIGVIVRYSVLLAGLIVTLPRSVEADRPDIFREFARAMAISRHNNSVAARVEVDNEVAPAPRPSSKNGSLHAYHRSIAARRPSSSSRSCESTHARTSSASRPRTRRPSREPAPATFPWYPCSNWITRCRTVFRSASRLTSTCGATPSPSRRRPSRICSVPM